MRLLLFLLEVGHGVILPPFLLDMATELDNTAARRCSLNKGWVASIRSGERGEREAAAPVAWMIYKKNFLNPLTCRLQLLIGLCSSTHCKPSKHGHLEVGFFGGLHHSPRRQGLRTGLPHSSLRHNGLDAVAGRHVATPRLNSTK